MQRPHLSTGAWIFATAVAVAAITAPSVYAAVTSTVAIGNTSNNTTTTVTASHQLLTTTIAPKSVVTAHAGASGACTNVYTPAAGKAIVVTSVTYDMYNNTSGDDNYAYLEDANCNLAAYDIVETHQVDATETRTFPIGLPMPSVGLNASSSGISDVYITGYLIPASQLPAAAPANLPARLAHPTH